MTEPVRARCEYLLGTEAGEADLLIEPDALGVGAALRIEWLDVDAVELAEAGAVRVRLWGGDLLELRKLKASAEMVVRAALEVFEQACAVGLCLDDGVLLAPPFPAQHQGAAVRVRVYERALAVLGGSDPVGLPLGEVEAIGWDAAAYAITVGPLRLTHAGRRTDQLRRTLEQALAQSRNALAARLTEWLADLGPLPARKIAGFVRDGRAIARGALEQAAPGAWDRLVARGALPERADKLAALLAHASGEPWVGLKQLADPRPILFFLVPRAGGELAFEVASEADHATYRFAGCTPEELARALCAVRLRREPIFGDAGELARGPWRMLARRSSPLRALRGWFRGREIHRAG